ncbi:MAG: hypothetical protein ACTSYA_04180, partial [Candidatus Kariarchaeaceae archaeon]
SSWSGEDIEGGIIEYSTISTGSLPSIKTLDQIVLSTDLINITETALFDLMGLEMTMDTNLTAEWTASAQLLLPEGLAVDSLSAIVSTGSVVTIRTNLTMSLFYHYSAESFIVKLKLFSNDTIYQIKEFTIAKPLEDNLSITPGYVSKVYSELIDRDHNGLYDIIEFTATFFAFEKTSLGLKAYFPEIDFEFEQFMFDIFEIKEGLNNLSLSIHAEILQKINYTGQAAVRLEFYSMEWSLVDGGYSVVARIADHTQTVDFYTSEINYLELEFPMICVTAFDVSLLRDYTDLIYQIEVIISLNVSTVNMFYIRLDGINNDTSELISQENKNRAYSVGYYTQTYSFSGTHLLYSNTTNLRLEFYVSLADGSIIEYWEDQVSFNLDELRESGIVSVEMLSEVTVDEDLDGLLDGIRLAFEIELVYSEEFVLYLGLSPSIGEWTIGTSRTFYPSVEREQALVQGKNLILMTVVDMRFAISYYNDTWDWNFEVRNLLDCTVLTLNGTTESYSYSDFDLNPPEINDELRDANIVIIYPYAGYSISQTVELIWNAVVPFGAGYNYTVILIDSIGNEEVIATNIQNNSYLWNTRSNADGIYSIRVEGENNYFSTYDTIQAITIENATTETKDDASLSYLFIIELIVIVSIVVRRKKTRLRN